MSPFSMYFVKYKASPGSSPSLYALNRGYGLINDPWITLIIIATNKSIKRILHANLSFTI